MRHRPSARFCKKIELKSENIGEDRIRKQLEQNRYYLAHAAHTIFSFTYIMDTGAIYYLNERNYMRQCSADDLIAVLRRPVLQDYLAEGIDRYFRASDYLIMRSTEKAGKGMVQTCIGLGW